MTITNTNTEYRDLPLSVLAESKTNPRRFFEDSALKEFADFVSGHKIGLLFRRPQPAARLACRVPAEPAPHLRRCGPQRTGRFCVRAQKRPFVPQTVLLPRKRGAAWKQAAPLRNRHITITASQAISTAVDHHAMLSFGETIPKFRLEGDKPPQQPAWSSR